MYSDDGEDKPEGHVLDSRDAGLSSSSWGEERQGKGAKASTSGSLERNQDTA